jgi:hypothetical protein
MDTDKKKREGGALRSVRALVANQKARVGKRRRAEDCASYPV